MFSKDPARTVTALHARSQENAIHTPGDNTDFTRCLFLHFLALLIIDFCRADWNMKPMASFAIACHFPFQAGQGAVRSASCRLLQHASTMLIRFPSDNMFDSLPEPDPESSKPKTNRGIEMCFGFYTFRFGDLEKLRSVLKITSRI